MGLNKGVLSTKDRAKQIAGHLKEKIYIKDITKAYSCSYKTAREVYRIKGWEVIGKKEAGVISQQTQLKRNRQKAFNSSLLSMRWI